MVEAEQVMTTQSAFRGSIAHCRSDPYLNPGRAIEYFDDGLLLVDNGSVVAVGPAVEMLQDESLNGVDITDYTGQLIIPGLVDIHMHYPQTDVIASYGTQLLEWLEKYTFPAEMQFRDAEHALAGAEFFVEELLRNGTTTALVFATVHKESADALFRVAERLNLRLVTGKVMMDRNCPEGLRDTPEQGYEESQQLIDRWHGVQRLSYAVTPRFAPTSSDRQLALAGKLFNDNAGVYLQSHVAENEREVAWVGELFPWARSYLDVYDHFGMLGERAVYAHCIHLNETDLQRMQQTATVAAFCPTSNLFLGSGLFDFNAVRRAGVRTGLASDVGGGTSFSMLRTADEAYKVSQLANSPMTPEQLFYEMTLGGASALGMEQCIGNFETGKEADFTVIDPTRTRLLERRISLAGTIEEKLFALMLLGDDRCTTATYLMGRAAYTSSQ